MRRLLEAWRLLNLPCEGMSRLASESLDRELSRLERVALRSHLLYCTACRRYRRQLERIRGALRKLAGDLEAGVPSPGPRLPDEVRERIKRVITSSQ
jgi:predicted anti-sigma-YlaC factor YlaD